MVPKVSIYPRDISHALAATESVGTVRTVYIYPCGPGSLRPQTLVHSGLGLGGLLDVT